ncbi:glycoside hydrolase family 26 protein [Streptomyces griseorubiginosus]|uniref:glycoside hydrolase family 26 protein n=1 Tax=Streptomyces griseorubiginosus TaxID=67304 RepID=UPI0036868D6E
MKSAAVPRSARRGLLALAVVLLLLVSACTERAPAPEPAAVSAYGAYVGYEPSDTARLMALGAWLGGPAPRVGHVYLPGDRWSNIDGAPGYLESWAAWRRADPRRMFVLNVPMLERSEAHLPDSTVAAELRRGARGVYDAHFRVLAGRLVALGVPDTVVVLGWEMNGTTYTHRCGPDPAAWRAYWARIVRAMRAVPGQRLRFEFTPTRGRDAIPWPRCYPGDEVVDIVGMDAYDAPRGLGFSGQLDEPYGLRAHVRFARAHGKPFSYQEWGLFENGDNPAYMRGMLTWFAEQRPLYQSISDYCPHGVWSCRSHPRSTAVYRALMGAEEP